MEENGEECGCLRKLIQEQTATAWSRIASGSLRKEDEKTVLITLSWWEKWRMTA